MKPLVADGAGGAGAKASSDVSAALLAKGALKRLAAERLEPTPENYARAYRLEGGLAAASSNLLPAGAQRLIERVAVRAFDGDGSKGSSAFCAAMAEGRWSDAERVLEDAPGAAGDALAALIRRIVLGLERGGRNWTLARRKVGIQRVLESSRADARRLQHRLSQLMASWDSDSLVAEGSADEAEGKAEGNGPAPAGAAAGRAASAGSASAVEEPQSWGRIAVAFSKTLQQALPTQDGANRDLLTGLEAQTARLLADGATAESAAAVEQLCTVAGRVLQHRHHLFDQLGKLALELTASLAELAENDSWVKGQCDAMQMQIEDGLTARGVSAVNDMLRTTRARHGGLKAERERARDALKVLINRMLGELAELGSKTGSFHESVGRYAAVIEEAETLESLTGVVREMVEESRTVQSLVQQAQQRLDAEHNKATDLSQRVNQLEDEMRRLSDEVSTDQLTKISNRRGLMLAFEAERSRMQRSSHLLSIGLLDIDNFKRLNDELGHSAGDEALKSLAAIISKTLRPADHVARYGGEEFVVLLGSTPIDEAEQILTRLQRSLTGGLFLHKEKQVFVTFSAGVTAYRRDEKIEDALERADQALYEAKRTGKNRTCIG